MIVSVEKKNVIYSNILKEVAKLQDQDHANRKCHTLRSCKIQVQISCMCIDIYMFNISGAGVVLGMFQDSSQTADWFRFLKSSEIHQNR